MRKGLKWLLHQILAYKSLRDILVNALARGGWVSGVRDSPLASETSIHRESLIRYCEGNGIDVGFGGDPIHENAVRIDLPNPYSTGIYANQLSGDAARLFWFADDALDYVFSSHLLEDFLDTRAVLKEWLRVLKPGGALVIGCPDEQRYRQHCERTGQPRNDHHIHADFSLAKVRAFLAEIGNNIVVHEDDAVGDYSWELVVKKGR
jgi:predicted SAM-dependent methyltransferase